MTAVAIEDLRALAAELSPLLGRIAIREVLCVASRLKPARVSVPQAAVEDCTRVLERHGLCVAPGDSPLWIAADEGKGGWSSRPGTPGEGEPWRHLYVAWSSGESDSLRRAEQQGNDDEFGRRLLIPTCCRAMFLDRFAEASRSQGDLFAATFPRPTSRCAWRVNLGAQYFDAAMLSHYPCSAHCEASATLATLAWRIVAATAPTMAGSMAALMKSICVYSEREGVHLLPEARTDGDWIMPGRLIHSTDAEGALLAALKASEKVACREADVLVSSRGRIERSLKIEGLRIVIPQEGAERS
jgi:hypothetical protein